MNHRVAAAVCAAALLSTPAPVTAAPKAEPTACYNAIYLTRDQSLLRLDDAAAEPTPVARFDAPLDAVAYVPATQAFWAVSGDEVVSFDQAGRITTRKQKPAALRGQDPVDLATGATGAATGRGDHWIVRTGREIVTYRMPALKEVDRHRLTGADILLPHRIADWDVNEADGRLYTIASGPPARLVRIDPRTGTTTAISAPRGLPALGTFGAIAVDPQGTLHALHDQTGRLYDIKLDEPTKATGKGRHHTGDRVGCRYLPRSLGLRRRQGPVPDHPRQERPPPQGHQRPDPRPDRHRGARLPSERPGRRPRQAGDGRARRHPRGRGHRHQRDRPQRPARCLARPGRQRPLRRP